MSAADGPTDLLPDQGIRPASDMRSLSRAEVVFFVCYAVCRLHAGTLLPEDRTAWESSLVDHLLSYGLSMDDWKAWAGAAVRETAAYRRDLPVFVAGRLGDALGLGRAEALRIAEAACSYLDAMRLNDYIDGVETNDYDPARLAAEIAATLTPRSAR